LARNHKKRRQQKNQLFVHVLCDYLVQFSSVSYLIVHATYRPSFLVFVTT